jgi:hypothetical protein
MSEFRYRAFISYRHADNVEPGRKWADWLHSALERYEIPTELVEASNNRGGVVPDGIYPVFQDEKELAADSDLDRPIKEALAASEVLIVICSPRAVSSRYVASEIEHFKEMGREDKILALIVDGVPNSDVAVLECFPQALKNASGGEPLAADVRAAGDGQGWTSVAACRTALIHQGLRGAELSERVRAYGDKLDRARLKLIAGVLGVPLGELTQREQHYLLEKAAKRQRLVTRLAVVFGVLALLAMTGGGIAWWQWQEATRQRDRAIAMRQKAEQTIEFMQHDLSKLLAPHGLLDVHRQIEQRVGAYYEGLEGRTGIAGFDSNRAAAALARSKTASLDGDGDAAMAHCEEALAEIDELRRQHPNMAPLDTLCASILVQKAELEHRADSDPAEVDKILKEAERLVSELRACY